MSITTLSALPTAPNRTDQSSVFVARADAWVSALEDFTTEFNSNVADLNQVGTDAATASTAATTAAAHANYKGPWSSQTGAAAIPYSVSHGGKDYRLIAALADVTTVEPGVTSGWETYWEELTSGSLAGLNAQSISADATLNTGSLVHDITATADDLNLSLPDASNFDAGSLGAIITNRGNKRFHVTSASGGFNFGELWPGQTIHMYCRSNSAGDGTWIGSRLPMRTFQGLVNDAVSVGTIYMNSCRVATNKVLATFRNTSNGYCNAFVVRLDSSGMMEIGSSTTIDGETSYQSDCCETDTDDEAIIINGDASNLNAHFITISGTTITVADTEDSIFSGATYTSNNQNYPISVERIDTDKFVVGFANTSNYPQVGIVETSGTTISGSGSAVQVQASAGSYLKVSSIQDGNFAIGWLNAGSSAYVKGYTVSGTVPTGGSVATLATGMSGGMDFTMLPNGVGVACCVDSTSSHTWAEIYACTISGTTATKVGEVRWSYKDPVNYTPYPTICPVTDSTFVCRLIASAQNYKDPFLLASCCDDAELKILAEWQDKEFPGDQYITNASYNLVRMEDGLVFMTGTRSIDNYAVCSMMNFPELM